MRRTTTHFGPLDSATLSDVSIKEIVDLLDDLRRTSEHCETIAMAMGEIKTTVDHWGEEIPSLNKGTIKCDVDRLREVIDWCLENIEKNRKR